MKFYKSWAINTPKWFPIAYPTIPAAKPVTSASLFFIAAETIGTKGGEFMNATDEITIESASTFVIRQKTACKANDMKTAIAIKHNRPIPLSKLNFEKSAIEAIVILNI